jgi:hypothetical protein
MKAALSAYLLVLAGCSSPTGVKVIIGARLDTIPYSVVVIADGKIRAAGAQSEVPVPKGSEITRGTGKIVEAVPSSGKIAAGEPADLLLRDAATGSVEMAMHAGEWQK